MMKDGKIYSANVHLVIAGYGNRYLLCRDSSKNDDHGDIMWGIRAFINVGIVGREWVGSRQLVTSEKDDWKEFEKALCVIGVVALSEDSQFSSDTENVWNLEN